MYSNYNCNIDSDKISQLIDKLGYFLNDYNLEIDSRKANSLSIFCAYPGGKHDGRDFIADLIKCGVGCIIEEGNFDLTVRNHYSIENLRDYVGLLASYKYNNPSKHMQTIGVTGTNGKTSITQWLAQVYTNLGKKTAVVGTLGAGIFPEITDYASTTPDPITLQKLLADFLVLHVNLVAMEVSSHGLDQGRVNGIQFETAIFTNLTQDHLDYHLTMENYYNAKRRLFYWQGLQNIIINTDDSYGRQLYREISTIGDSKLDNGVRKIISYGIHSGDVTATNISIGLYGTKFTLSYNLQQIEIYAQVIGQFNIYNMLAVICCLILDGYLLEDIAKNMSMIKPVYGRMDAMLSVAHPLVIVDFAHTPDALENVLQTLHEIEHKGRIFCIFGCGGDRDRTKRPIMGSIAVTNADYVIITSDNPRTEDPASIIDQIVVGIPDNNKNFEVVVDRKMAIKTAVTMAKDNDIILIAGKGHEQYQEINGVKHEFSDFELAKNFLYTQK